ncbi:HalOD1 output domain-containing protein [Natranaeroarchaeum sulfidigenes]|uniref:Halobacterial output domain-containing protein n=1 Tax=Natranaeroarchaeum sulfidigenes TaxID=2784880 RepID=A0A897MSU3_9EURY|nr:HalOD1 output domain-containing protein [Natranaeroarchaeum sulfidigenes]QSG03371.1 Uncharacterized protein AArcS_2173 [Natranaeroarchaeum sulfidigenes]
MTKEISGGTMSDDDPATEGATHWSQVSQHNYRPDGNKELTTVIIYALAEAEDRPPVEIKSPPLYDFVDVPAIEAAFFGPDVTDDSRQGVGTVEFQYDGYMIKIRSDGWVQVYEPAEADLS